jgi:hypothetical protein
MYNLKNQQLCNKYLSFLGEDGSQVLVAVSGVAAFPQPAHKTQVDTKNAAKKLINKKTIQSQANKHKAQKPVKKKKGRNIDKQAKKQTKGGVKTSGKGGDIGRTSRQGTTNGCLAANCLDLAVYYIGLVRTKVANYQKQLTRISKLTSATTSKLGKRDAFANTLNLLLQSGGGNLSRLACGVGANNTNNAGKIEHGWILITYCTEA